MRPSLLMAGGRSSRGLRIVKRQGLDRGVWRGDIWGKRLEKYQTTADGTLRTVEWLTLAPDTPFYFFARQDAVLRDEYDKGLRLTEIFPINVLGFQTHRDAFAISFTLAEMKQ